jgi:hypothetical protein
MRDIYTISPHVLVGDGSVLTLPTDDDDRLGIAVFQSKGLAEELAPDGFRPAYCGPEELEKLAEDMHIWLVALVQGGLQGSVFTVDMFTALLQMGEEQ